MRSRAGWALSAALCVAACRPAGVNGGTTVLNNEQAMAPPRVTGANFAELARQLDEQAPGRANRPLRDAVASYWAARGVERLTDGDYDGAVNAMRGALLHYTPEELRAGQLPDGLAPLARGLLTVANPRGDEPRVLAANRVLSLLRTPDRAANDRFNEARRWGEDNRREFRPPWVFHAEMAEVFREVANLLPERSLVTTSREHSEQRRAAALRELGRATPEPLPEEQVVMLRRAIERPVIDVMILYLRLGDVSAAAEHVETMSGGGSRGLAALLHSLVEDDSAEGYVGLAQQLERVDSPAMAGVCRLGRRRFATDARFAQCLSLAAARDGQLGLSAMHMESAARIREDDPEVLGRAIATTARWLEGETASEDPTSGRAAIARLRAQSADWARRFSGRPAPVTEAEIDLAAAQHEVGAANLSAAEPLLDRAMGAARPPRGAFLLRAEIAWRKGDGARASAVLERAAALPLTAQESGSEVTPLVTLRRGLALASVNDAGARALLEQAEAAYIALARSMEGDRKAAALMHHALAADALGRADAARQSWDDALTAAPDDRGIASAATVFFLGRGRFSDAARVAGSARARLTLDRSWQSYFALWQWHASRLAGEEDDRARAALREIANAAGERSPWTTRLAQRAAGALTFAQLEQHAQTPGQRAEAHFYEALTRLSAGDREATRAQLRATVQTDMLRFNEYDAAWELLRAMDRPGFSAATVGPALSATTTNGGTASAARR